MTIWKFGAPINDKVRIQMPLGAWVVSVQIQGNAPCVWALVDETLPSEPRDFCWRGTGHPADGLGRFIGTVLTAGDTLVFHLFEAGRQTPMDRP